MFIVSSILVLRQSDRVKCRHVIKTLWRVKPPGKRISSDWKAAKLTWTGLQLSRFGSSQGWKCRAEVAGRRVRSCSAAWLRPTRPRERRKTFMTAGQQVIHHLLSAPFNR